MDINTKKEAIKYKERVLEYEKVGVDFGEAFNTISHLSSEFHELFAVLTYQQVETGLKEGNQKSAYDMLCLFEKELADKDLDKMSESQRRSIEKLRRKESSQLDSKQLDNILRIRDGNKDEW